MRIVVDSDIWGGGTLFANIGEVVLCPGREIRAADLEGADALVVRSITRVNEALLADSPVRFVGTATSGVDHVDTDYLAQRGIAFATAAGCNSRPVVEYVLSCLFEWHKRTGRPLADAVLGVIGVGRIGRGVAEWGAALGMRVMGVDPPMQQAGVPGLHALELMLPEADIVTLHVPLTLDGRDSTRGMINARRLAMMKPDAWLIHTARGGVVDESDLVESRANGHLGGAILDVWEGEPVAPPELLQIATLMTPHIAGYSAAAHRRAAVQIAAAMCLSLDGRLPDGVELPKVTAARLGPVIGGAIAEEHALSSLEAAVSQACDVAAIDLAFRQKLRDGLPAAAFDAIRVDCRGRRELTEIAVDREAIPAGLNRILTQWGGGR